VLKGAVEVLDGVHRRVLGEDRANTYHLLHTTAVQ
jgi:hypothetical protein